MVQLYKGNLINSNNLDRFKNKTEIRCWAKELRKDIDIKKVSSALTEELESMAEYKKAKNIMLFYPLKYEIDCMSLINDTEKSFYLPKISGENILCCPVNQGTTFCKSCFNTLEPDTTPCDKSNLDMIIIPALACDKTFNRLGYGKGFYDRFLKEVNAIKIVCIPRELLVETVFPDKNDVAVDIILTN